MIKSSQKETSKSKGTDLIPSEGIPTTISTDTSSVDKELLNKSVTEILSKVSKLDKEDIVTQLRTLLLGRIRNEFYISEAIKLGIDAEEFSIETAVKLLQSSKDGIGSLTSALKEFEDNPARGGNGTKVIIIRDGSAPVVVDSVKKRKTPSAITNPPFIDETINGN